MKKRAKPIVLVDEKDAVLGFGEKFSTHKIPVPLHRAISIVIFNADKMLITKRAATKPTWGGVWSNAVCTHPYPEESYKEAAERRIYEELGFKTPLKEVFIFTYQAEMDDRQWGECELDHVFVGNYDGQLSPNPEEIDDYKWIEVKKLKKDLLKSPRKYTPWFKLILEKF
ncbi:isopentenyl-diphosphate delta-isomerase [Candidatus Woesebacteria bacterium RIFOXYC1_FULL_41_14]|uniref:Isopentenyl-diphosphate delta-isomerase n=5 Tax=Candidatus Woeseibacteriota TaxID=1752722 RepID=A0A1F8DJN5_9BACT|nr:MAG: Isopentenyl-diphosphate Delta-isomerase [Candidatus Woesebacteria bacterium GW2011_GWD1_41_12]KKS05525.1 MAG: Isopentenyl-diphosphate Delta-isomerase [Candidatus Woesebacteria bacterium GW2011_GWE1_41_24]OGM80826.1 MAG: isopentenyl-diphosphate delta-isomerase [Candidatus Woesebacteria bacterium RIFOXYB1_FULL_41_13]OGM83742.1 MAG: isopentenyl-diphosphate delta-isomerase [Candidatus Woesebacteria bacterium RIFOXYC1_FULL_41_14]OGM88843.1 MAG: isopentenyl-diphosphate delta-isomerase [Candid